MDVKEFAEETKAEEATVADESAMDESAEEAVEQRVDRIEDVARKKGWVSQKEWKKNPDEWVDAAEYVERQWDIADSLRKSNKNLSKQMDFMARQIGDLMQRTGNAVETQTADKIAALKVQKQRAVEEGNWDEEEKINDLIDAEKERIRTIKSAPPPQPGEDPLVTDWKERNPWYGADGEMTDIANRISADHPESSWKTILRLVDAEIALHRIRKSGDGNGNGKSKSKSRVPDVSSGRRTSHTEESYDLSGRADAREILGFAETMERSGIMSKKDYIKNFLKLEKQNAR